MAMQARPAQLRRRKCAQQGAQGIGSTKRSSPKTRYVETGRRNKIVSSAEQSDNHSYSPRSPTSMMACFDAGKIPRYWFWRMNFCGMYRYKSVIRIEGDAS